MGQVAGRPGKAEAWARYDAMPPHDAHDLGVIAGGEWTRCAGGTTAAIGRGIDVSAWVQSGREAQKGSRGAKTGNICGYVAACRAGKMLLGEEDDRHRPRMGYPFTTMFTRPEELVAYLESDAVPGLACRHRTFADADEYLADVRAEVARGRPTVVLVYERLTRQHYFTVVAFDGGGEGDGDGDGDSAPRSFAVLDYGGVRIVSADDLVRMSFNQTPTLAPYRTISIFQQAECAGGGGGGGSLR